MLANEIVKIPTTIGITSKVPSLFMTDAQMSNVEVRIGNPPPLSGENFIHFTRKGDPRFAADNYMENKSVCLSVCVCVCQHTSGKASRGILYRYMVEPYVLSLGLGISLTSFFAKFRHSSIEGWHAGP